MKPYEFESWNHKAIYNQLVSLFMFDYEPSDLFPLENAPEEFEGTLMHRDYQDSANEFRTILLIKHKTKLGPLIYFGDKIAIRRIEE